MNTKRKLKRPKTDRVRSLAIYHTAIDFEVGENYIRQIVRGDLEQPEIKDHFNKLYNKVTKAIQSSRPLQNA